jgi:tetratricopeptide (TPR) repeat protein
VSRRLLFLIAVPLLPIALVVGAGVWSARYGGDPGAVSDDPIREEQAARVAVRDRPDDPQAHLRLARAARKLGRASEAEAALVQAVRLGVPEPDGQREAVLQLAAVDWPKQAEGLFHRVALANPDDQEVLTAVADAFWARELWLLAEAHYTRLLALVPGRSDWHFKRGVARMRAAYYATAVEDFRQVLANDPNHDQARLYLGHSLLGDARMEEAERELRICHENRPQAIEPLVGLASCAIERNDLAEAERLLGQAATLERESPIVLQELATLQLRQRRTDAAIATLQRLIARAPDHRQAHLQLSQALLAAGKPDEAKRHEKIYQDLDRKEEDRHAARRGMR